MGYIDQTFYDDEYQGTPVDAETFSKLEKRASDLIDMITDYKLLDVDLEQEPTLIKNNVKKAVAAQVEYMNAEGGELSVHGGSPAQVQIGGFSYSGGESGGYEARVISDMSYKYLVPTGLLYAGVSVRC